MFKTEEFKVIGIITLTLVLLLAFCLSASDILALLFLGLVGIVLALTYNRLIKKERIGPSDERSERISLMAVRNGFLAVILILAFEAVVIHLYGTLATTSDIVIIAWGLGVFVYLASYLANIRQA